MVNLTAGYAIASSSMNVVSLAFLIFFFSQMSIIRKPSSLRIKLEKRPKGECV